MLDKIPIPTLVDIASTYRHAQNVRELVCFCLSEAVSCVCDKHDWYPKLTLIVDQLLKSLLCGGDGHLPPHEDPVDVEQQAKAGLWWLC